MDVVELLDSDITFWVREPGRRVGEGVLKTTIGGSGPERRVGEGVLGMGGGAEMECGVMLMDIWENCNTHAGTRTSTKSDSS